MAVRGEGLRTGTVTAVCSSVWEELSSSSCPDARHFGSSLYATGALQGAAPVQGATGHESKYVLVQGVAGVLPRGDA